MAEDQIHIVITVVGEPDYIKVYREQIERDIASMCSGGHIRRALNQAAGGVRHYITQKVDIQQNELRY